MCILDPEGDYRCLDSLPGVIVRPLDGDDAPLSGLERVLTQPDLSVVVDMSAATQKDRSAVVRRVLELANRVRRHSGLPHQIVIDEAHYFLGRTDDPVLFDRELGGHLLVTYRIADLPADVLGATDAVIVTQVANQRQALALGGLSQPEGTTSEWLHSLAGLAIDEALLLPGSQESGDRLTRFRIAPRMTAHVRHREKYSDIPVRPGREFVFTKQGRATGQRARSLSELVLLLPKLADEVFKGHLARGDFHRLGRARIRRHRAGQRDPAGREVGSGQAREAMMRVISERYGEPSEERGDN